MAGVGTEVSLLLVEAPPALRQVQSPAIWAGWVDSGGDYNFCFSKWAEWPVGLRAFRIVIGSTQ